MRIRTKIAIIYAWLTFMVLLCAFAIVYALTVRNTEQIFYDLLWKRAMITAQYNFEKDEMTESAYQGVVESFKAKLTGEEHIIINANDGYEIDSLKNIIPRQEDLRMLLKGKTIEYREGDRQYLGVYYPDNEGNFIVIVSAQDKQGAESTHNLLEVLGVILVLGTVIAFFIGMIYAKNIMSPVVRIINNVKSITANNLKSDLIESRGNDELSELSRTFNDMILRLRDAFDMQNSFIRNASHELRNPLTAIIGETEIALTRTRTTEEYIETLKVVSTEAERLNIMMQGLLTLAQTGFDFSRVMKERIDLRQVAESVKGNYKDVDIYINTEKDRPYIITGVNSLLSIALINVVGNAIKFSSGKPVTISIGEKNNKYYLKVTDKGIGIPNNEIKRIFQPFYRARNTANFKGTGIGLALTFKVVDLHEGKLSIDSSPGEGTTITMSFKKG